ncbi:MAG: DUF3078 domain-containing protein [Prolixibacteraceae bacterium]
MNYRFFLAGLLFILIGSYTSAFPVRRGAVEGESKDSVKISVDYLKYFLQRQGNWYPKSPDLEKNLNSLIHFVEDEKVDTALLKLKNFRTDDQFYFYRSPRRVADSLSVSGYVSQVNLKEQLKRIDRNVKSSIVKEQIPVPEELFADIDSKVKLVPQNDAEWLVRNSKITLSDSLRTFNAIPDSMISDPDDLKKVRRLNSARRAVLEKARIEYNSKIRKLYIDSVSDAYRNDYIAAYSRQVQKQFADSMRRQNYERLVQFNDSVMKAVNDSIGNVLKVLTAYAEKDSVSVWLHNSDRDSVQMWLRNNDPYFTRLFIKNEQNDSLGVRVENTGKNAMRFMIDDGVTFSRFARRQTKDVNLPAFKAESSLRKVQQRYNVVTPWTLTGRSNLGFTQTTLSNWKAGGDNSLAFLFVFDGAADYAKNDITWRNSFQLRNGWVKPGGDKIEKNDDAVELISRFGVKAAKNWYYSAEGDFRTQFFNGYKYPNRNQAISGFLSPAYLVVKLGFDYNPNKELSLLLSPLSAKMTYVKDTAKVDPTSYGIEEGENTYWQTGLSADLNWKKQITPNVIYNTKYKMFVNYASPFSKFDIRWENDLSVQLSTFISMNIRYYLVYDDDAKFKTGRFNSEGAEIMKAKWQMKELITVGFSYTLNKKIYRRKKIG